MLIEREVAEYKALRMKLEVIDLDARVIDVTDVESGTTLEDIVGLVDSPGRRLDIYPEITCTGMRSMFDRHAELTCALHARCLEMHEDSEFCGDFVVWNRYLGPQMVGTEDPMQSVVEMMDEMGFLYAKTTFGRRVGRFTRGALRKPRHECENAKLGAIREYMEDGHSIDGLPPRLRRLVSLSLSDRRSQDIPTSGIISHTHGRSTR